MSELNREALRKIFSGAEIEVPKDVLTQICDLHLSSTDGMTETIKDLNKQLKKAERERDDALTKIPEEGKETVAKEDYDKLKKEYDDYKADITAKNTRTEKENAFRELLKSAGVSEKRLNAIIKVSDIDSLELDKDGKIKDAEKHTENVKNEWADFIETTTTKGANTANPPANNGKGTGKTKEEILAIKDGAVRRQEMLNNPHLFGLENK